MKKMTTGIDVATGEIVEREFTAEEYAQAEEDAKTADSFTFEVAELGATE